MPVAIRSSWSYNPTMKVVSVSELKAHLSQYLRLAARGVRITVRDRDKPVAELGPTPAEPLAWRDRLAAEGRLRPGTQDWRGLEISPPGRRVDIQASLGAVRNDPDEVRRRERGAPDPVR